MLLIMDFVAAVDFCYQAMDLLPIFALQRNFNGLYYQIKVCLPNRRLTGAFREHCRDCVSKYLVILNYVSKTHLFVSSTAWSQVIKGMHA